MSGKRNSLKLAELQQTLPGYGEAAENALLLRAAMFDHVTEADIGAIIQAQVQKAKSGDPKAAKFVLDMISAAAPKTTLNIGFIAGAAEPEPSPNGPAGNKPLRLVNKKTGDPEFDKADETPRLEAARLLRRKGPMRVPEIARELGYPVETITRALGKDPLGWFALDGGKYGLTGIGREVAAT